MTRHRLSTISLRLFACVDREMELALIADGKKLRQLTGEDHGPWFLEDCPACDGKGITVHATTVYEAGCGFPHDDSYELKCEACDGFGTIVVQP